jgi:hypothetical protein
MKLIEVAQHYLRIDCASERIHSEIWPMQLAAGQILLLSEQQIQDFVVQTQEQCLAAKSSIGDDRDGS